MILPFLVLLAIATNCTEFHLEKTIKLPLASGDPVSSMTMINQQKLGLIQTNPSTPTTQTISILSDPNYQTKQKQVVVSALASGAKFAGEDIILNYGNNITFDSESAKRKWEFKYDFMMGKLLVMGGVALVPQEMGCPTIVKLDLVNMVAQKVEIQTGSGCLVSKFTYLRDLENGRILYMTNYTIYFLNSQSLKVQQKIDKSPYLYEYVSSYTDQVSQDSTILLSRGAFSEYMILTLNKDSNKYELNPNEITLKGVNITLTDTSSAITAAPGITGNEILKFKIFSNFVAIDFMTANQSLLGRYCQAINKEEDQFVVFSQQNGSFTFYNFSQQFQIANVREVKLPSFTSVGKAQYTEDSQNLLVIDSRNFYRIPINQDNYTSEANDMNCSNLILVKNGSAGSRNVFVTSCITTIDSIKTCFLQLRSSDDLSILSTYQLNLTKPIYSIRLLSNEAWQQHFLVLVQTSLLKDTSVAVLMKIQDNLIIQTEITSSKLSYARTEVCSEYIAGFKSDVTADQEYLRIYHYSNFTEVTRFYYAKSKYSSQFDILAAGNALIIETFYSGLDTYYYNTDYYVLAGDPATWCQGSEQRSYFQRSVKSSNQVGYMIFPNRKLYYLHTTQTIGPIKLIFNISNPTISEKYQIESSSTLKAILYTTSSSSRAGFNQGQQLVSGQLESNSCNSSMFIIDNFVINRIFKRFYDCQPYQPIVQYSFQPVNASASIGYPQIFKASTNQHIILIYTAPTRYQIDIRLISDPSVRVWFQQLENSNYFGNRIYSVDVTNSGLVLISMDTTLYARELNSNEFSNSYKITRISVTDTNSKGCFAFAGISVTSPNTSRIIFKENLNKTAKVTDFAGVVSSLALSEENTYLAVSSNTQLLVHSIIGDFFIVLALNYTQITQLKFINQQTLLIKQNTSFQIIHIAGPAQANNQPLSTSISTSTSTSTDTYKIAVSKDTKLVAKTTNPTTLQITKDAAELVVQFSIPSADSSPIADLAFMANNSLLVATEAGLIYSLSPTPCPDTFVNFNGLCLCRVNSTEILGKCTCNHNFVQSNDTCICPEPFEFTNSECLCKMNSSQVQGACKCNQNFISVNHDCLCPQSFQFADNQCKCLGYIQDSSCHECGTFCETCSAPGFNCTSYKPTFYVMVIGGSLLVVIVVVAVVLVVRKRRAMKMKGEEDVVDPLVEEND